MEKQCNNPRPNDQSKIIPFCVKKRQKARISKNKKGIAYNVALICFYYMALFKGDLVDFFLREGGIDKLADAMRQSEQDGCLNFNELFRRVNHGRI